MAQDTLGVTTLSTIALNLKNRLGDYDTENYLSILQLCIDAYMQFNIFQAVDNYKTVYFTLDENNSVPLPPDYIEYTKIGIIICGKIWNIGLADNMAFPHGELCGEPISKIKTCCENNQQNDIQFPTYGYNYGAGYNYWGNEYRAAAFGLGGGFATNYYRIDMQNRMLIITGIPREEIVMEYRSSGISADGNNYVPAEVKEAIVAWVKWQLTEYGRLQGNAERAKQNYLQEEARLINLKSARTASEWINAILSTTQQSIKR